MSVVAWQLTLLGTGESRTLADWRIRNAVRTLVNQGRSTLKLDYGLQDLLGASPLNYRDELRLDRVEDAVATPVFVGLVVSAIRGAYGSSEGFGVTVADPWWYLENIVYTQPANFASDVSDLVVGAASVYPLVAKETSQILFAEDQARSRVDSRFMIIEALTFAISKGAPIQIGTIDPGISMPREILSDVTCAQVILKSLRWTPGQSSWFDYTLDPPALNIRERASLSILECDVAAGELEAVELNPRPDLVIPGVTINYLRKHQRYERLLISGDPITYQMNAIEVLTLDPETAGPEPAGIGALIVTMELYGSTVYQTAPEPDPSWELVAQEDTPVGIAQALYDAYSALQYEGRIGLVMQEARASAWLAMAVQMLNGSRDWTDQLMSVRQATDDIFRGRTELTIGPPGALGPSDLLGLLRKGKTLPPPRGYVFGRDNPSPVPTIPPTPTTVPTPPGSAAHPPPPDTDPHTDYDPRDYFVSNTLHSGDATQNTGPFPFSSLPSTFVPLAGDPATPLLAINHGSIEASIIKNSTRTASAGATTYSESKSASRSYTVTEFDLHLFDTAHVKSIWLVGTQTKSKADGTSETTELKVDVSGGIGGRTTYTASAAIGLTRQYDDSVNFQHAHAHGSISLPILRVFLRPPAP